MAVTLWEKKKKKKKEGNFLEMEKPYQTLSVLYYYYYFLCIRIRLPTNFYEKKD